MKSYPSLDPGHHRSSFPGLTEFRRPQCVVGSPGYTFRSESEATTVDTSTRGVNMDLGYPLGPRRPG